MTWILIAALLVFTIVGGSKGTNPVFDFSHPDFMTKGIGGMLNAMLLYVYSCTGYSMTMNYGRDAKNARPKCLRHEAPAFLIPRCLSVCNLPPL